MWRLEVPFRHSNVQSSRCVSLASAPTRTGGQRICGKGIRRKWGETGGGQHACAQLGRGAGHRTTQGSALPLNLSEAQGLLARCSLSPCPSLGSFLRGSPLSSLLYPTPCFELIWTNISYKISNFLNYNYVLYFYPLWNYTLREFIE